MAEVASGHAAQFVHAVWVGDGGFGFANAEDDDLFELLVERMLGICRRAVCRTRWPGICWLNDAAACGEAQPR